MVGPLKDDCRWFAYEGRGVLWGRLWRWLVAHVCVVVFACGGAFGILHRGFFVLLFDHYFILSPVMAILALIFGPLAIGAVAVADEWQIVGIVALYAAYLALVLGYLLSTNAIVRRILLALLLAVGVFSVYCEYGLVWSSC